MNPPLIVLDTMVIVAAVAQRRKELLMREGYEEMAEHDAELLKEFEHVDSETPLPEYAEK